MAAAEGTVDVVLPATRGDILDRNGEPLADSVDGLMVVADPLMTADRAPEIATFLSKRLDVDYFGTLERLRVEDSRFQYIARQVPATLARTSSTTPRRSASRASSPARPGAVLPRARRRGQPRRFPRHPGRTARPRAAGLEDTFDGYSPAPTARRATRWARATGSRSATTR